MQNVYGISNKYEQFQTNQDRDEMHLVALLNWCSLPKWEDMKHEGRLCQQCCIEEVREALEAMLRESNLSSLTLARMKDGKVESLRRR